MASKSLISENPTDYQQVYTQQQLQAAMAQSGLSQQSQDAVIANYNNIVSNTPPPGSGPGGSGSGSSTPNPKWVYAVNMPSTFPDFAAMKAAGAGMVVDINDPNAALLIAEAKKWGLPVGIQVGAGNPGDMTPEQFAAKVQQAKDMGADKLVLDIEAAGKGTPGTAGWDWAQAAAAAVKPIAAGTSVAVTMEPHQDDYNYKAFQGLGSDSTQFWVQAYDGNMNDVNPDWAAASATAAVGAANVVTVLGPTTKPTGPHADGYVSFGIPLNGASAAGVYSPLSPGSPAPQPAPGSSPPHPSTTPPSGTLTPVGGNTTPGSPHGGVGIPGEIPAGPSAGQTVTPPGAPAPPNSGLPGDPNANANAAAAAAAGAGHPPTTGTTPTTATDWAGAYFGSMGLPSDVAAKVNEIFAKYPDTNEAINFALAYIRGTPWYAQTFPGIQYGIQHGLLSNEQEYRQYVTALDTLTQRYWGRHISGSEVSSYLFDGLTPDIIGKQYQGLANVQAYGKDYNYYLGAFSEEGRQSTDNLRSLGEEQAGLDTPFGQRLTRALNNAMQRYSKVFEGQASTPSLSLGKNGLTAPSLAGGNATPDTGA